MLSLCRHSPRFGYETLLAVTHDRRDGIPDLYTSACAEGIAAHLISCRRTYDFRALAQLRELIETSGADILHCHGYREDFYAVASRTHVGKVATNHLWKRTTPRLRFYAMVDRFLIKGFDRVVAVSREIFDELESKGIHPSRLVYIPNGIDVDRYAVARATRNHDAGRTKAALGLADSGTVLTTIGSLTEEKGHRYLLEAVARLPGAGAEWVLRIVGDGPEEPRLRQLARELGIMHAVSFLGRREDIPEILAATDIFVLPSAVEGLPIALLEAMAAGAACIATDVGDVSTVIEDATSGILVGKCDSSGLAAAISRLIGDEPLRRRMGEAAGRAIDDRFSSLRMVEAYCGLYDAMGSEADSESSS